MNIFTYSWLTTGFLYQIMFMSFSSNTTSLTCGTELPTLVKQNCLPLWNRTAYPWGTELPTLVEQNYLLLWNRTVYPCGTELSTLVEQNCLPLWNRTAYPCGTELSTLWNTWIHLRFLWDFFSFLCSVLNLFLIFASFSSIYGFQSPLWYFKALMIYPLYFLKANS